MEPEPEPEPEPRRWAATYTTQLKQKRKAYHDGALLFHPGRLVLLDDAGSAIDSRVLRAGESVSDGASLTFPCHLVDVGEPQRHHHACPSGSHSGGSCATAASRTSYRSGARASQSVVINPRAPRAFFNPPTSGGGGDKVEAVGSGGAEAEGSRFQEWRAMYTTQLTQKSKKYHDGFLRLVQIGSHAKQIVLLDEEGEVLGSRYFKSGECVESGTKCNLPNYLIEIGEAKNQHKGAEPNSSEEPMVRARPKNGENTSIKTGISATSSLKFISPQKFHYRGESKSEVTCSSNKSEVGKIEVIAAGSTERLMSSIDSCFEEWSVLYTNQLTQKAKKYHDGVIRLMPVGSHTKQIVLLDEEGGVLGSRYLKSGESVENGTHFQFPNYLIEVVELRNKKNDVVPKDSLRKALSHTGLKNGENTSDKIGERSKSSKFVIPLKLNAIHLFPQLADLQKSKSGSTAGSNRPHVGKSTCSNVHDPLNFHVFADLHRGKPDCTVYRRTDLSKSKFGNMDDPHKFIDIRRGKYSESATSYNWPEVGKSSPNRMDDRLEFCDLQDGKSVCPTSFTRRDFGKSTFGSMDDPLRTASQILSIMKPPAGLSHFATQLRTSVQSCLKLETVQAQNSVSHKNESSGNAYPTYDLQAIIKPAAFGSPELTMVDIPASEMPNASKQKLGSSSNHHTGNSNGTGSAPIMTATTIPGFQEDKSGTADQLVTNNTAVDPKCAIGSFLAPSIWTCKDPKIQDLIDDCPSFDLGF